MKRIRSVREVAGQYDAVLCDVWGVLHDGQQAYPRVADLLAELRASGLIVVLLSNVPRPAALVPDTLRRLGLPDDTWDAIVTSGDVTRSELARRSPGPVLRLGRDTDTALWEGLGLEFVDVARARFVAISGLRGPRETPGDYQPALRAARARDLELICANPDLKVPAGEGMAWCAGAVAWEYALLGGRVVMAGKPHGPIYARARAELNRVAHREVPAARILAIGDGIATDIAGANRVGLDCLFVATGLNGEALLSNGHLDLARAAAALAASHTRATYVMERLA
jgi:HAD superfamily hydrolase (TIGR01459 family)